MAQAIQALLIDDQELFSAGLRHLLESFSEPIELYEARSIDDAIEKKFNSPIQLLLTDLTFSITGGLPVVKKIKSHFPNAIVVVLSGNENPLFIRDAIERGAAGYIPKSVNQSVFFAALELLLAGEMYIPKQALDRFVVGGQQNENRVGDSEPSGNFEDLTERQKDSLTLAIKGLPNKEIARRLNISEGTVKAHLSAAFKVLGVRNRTEAVLRFAEVAASM